MDKITNYFINRQTSGFVEGLNNKIKVIKRRCYGDQEARKHCIRVVWIGSQHHVHYSRGRKQPLPERHGHDP